MLVRENIQNNVSTYRMHKLISGLKLLTLIRNLNREKMKMKSESRIKIVIVGAEQKYWSKSQEEKARMFIKEIMENFEDSLFISGDCPKGGVDIWVREIAQDLNKSFKSYPPRMNSWYWYRKRNMKMAQEGDLIINIEPLGHRSGGMWTMNYAKKIGKIGILVEF